MYHEIARNGSLDGYFAVVERDFHAQMRRIVELGVIGTSLEDIVQNQGNGVAITFDDAHRSVHERAAPILDSLKLRATIFVVTSWVGRSDYCSWGQLRELATAGHSIQSHTHTHPFLSTLSPAGVREELESSKARIEDVLGVPVTSIALPNGDAPRGWDIDDFQTLGYHTVGTSVWGPNRHGRRFVRRYTVRRATRLNSFDSLITASSSAWSGEGVRLRMLAAIRGALGVERYARWRRRIVNSPTSPG